ncbi:uncharacterized protein METZ01_LOCUS110765, partial [marine metagenome]
VVPNLILDSNCYNLQRLPTKVLILEFYAISSPTL